MNNTITAGGRIYNVYTFKGKVSDSKKTKTSYTTGSGGGGTNGNTAPVRITTEILTYDDFFLVNEEGKEKAFQLLGFDVACRENHDLQVLWAIENNQKEGPYIAVHNKTTNNNYFQDAELQKIFRGQKTKFWGIGAGIGILLGYLMTHSSGASVFIGLMGMGIGHLVWRNSGKKPAKEFKASFNPAQYN